MRLDSWDYGTSANYFVTICTANRALVLEDARHRTEVVVYWERLRSQYREVTLDAFVAMPNHVHGIVRLDSAGQKPPVSLPQVMRFFKTHSARRINNWRNARGSPVWQRGYWEHIIRDEDDLDRIRRYIAENPLNWESDPENPRASARKAEDLWDELLRQGALRLVE